MISKVFIISIAVLLLSLQVNAHAVISPALGASGKPVRNDAQKPNKGKPCGNADLSKVDSSTPVKANGNGLMTMTIQNFNAGVDGSREIKTLMIDESGTGKNFKAVGNNAITQNGDAKPTSTGTQQLAIQMPAGTKCTGGKGKNLCLLSLTTDGGFGNCVVASQGGAAKRDTRAIGSRAARAYLEGDIDDSLN